VQFLDSRQRNFKKITFLPPIFFSHQHTLIQNLCSNLTQFQLCFLYLKILLLSRYFFRMRPMWTASACGYWVKLLQKWFSCFQKTKLFSTPPVPRLRPAPAAPARHGDERKEETISELRCVEPR
jgi:hypothetical protein